MRISILLLLSLITLTSAKTIFIGNSLLRRNCAPCIFRKVCRASSSGSCGTSSLLKSGSTLTYHLHQRRTKRVLRKYRNPAVVLQEQSTQIQQSGYVETSLSTFSRTPGRVFLVGTWAHTARYYDVQFPLNHKFRYLARKHGITLAPVGEFWLYVHIFSPKLAMRLTTDGIHPSIEGSYLASCIIYRSIYKRHVYLGRRPKSINKSNYKLLQYYCNTT